MKDMEAVVAENGEKTKLVDDQAEFFIRFLKMSNPKSLLMSMKDLSSSVKSIIIFHFSLKTERKIYSLFSLLRDS